MKAYNETYYYHMFGEQGLSVHITENNEEILIGAPGVMNWKGTIIRHRTKVDDDYGGMSKRDIHTKAIEYTSDVPNPMLWDQPNDSYFGYAVTSGYFDGPQTDRLLYVASAPQANLQQGEVSTTEFNFENGQIKLTYLLKIIGLHI